MIRKLIALGLAAGLFAAVTGQDAAAATAPCQPGTPGPPPKYKHVAARRVTYSKTHLAWGVQGSGWNAWMHSVPYAGFVRVYYDTPDRFPATTASQVAAGDYSAIPPRWPVYRNPHTHRVACEMLSIRTMVRPLLTGQLDPMLRALRRTAPHIPHCDYLADWHEVNAPSRHYPRAVCMPYNFRRMTKYLMRFFKGSYVKVGAIVAGPLDKARRYLVKGEGFCSTDVYMFGPKDASYSWLSRRLSRNLAACQHATWERCPVYIQSETNTAADRLRPEWFSWMSRWYARHDKCAPYRAVATFWYSPGSPGGHHISGPWGTAGRRTRQALRTLSRDDLYPRERNG